MANASNDVMEMILKDCSLLGDRPWYPSEYAQATGMDRGVLDASVDQLRMAGLVELTEWVQGKGQGYVLTEAGHDVAGKPRLLNRIRQHGATAQAPPKLAVREYRHERPASFDRAKQIRDAMITPTPPRVTMMLIGINVLVFCIGWMLVAQRGGSVSEYMSMGMKRGGVVWDVQLLTGGLLLGVDVQIGHWWKLLTSCFVHHGLLHIGMNMFALYILGPFAEKMWGGFRFLIMYLVAGVGGSLTAVVLATSNVMLAGASGAICGILGSVLVWVLLNRSFLPTEFGSQIMRNTVINIVLITVISLVPGISWEGHLGGGVAGALISFPLNVSRFGRGSQRWLGWLAVFLLPTVVFSFTYTWVKPTNITVRGQYGPRMRRIDGNAAKVKDEFGKWANRVYRKEDVPNDETKKLLDNIQAAAKSCQQTAKLFADLQGSSGGAEKPALKHAEEYFQRWYEYWQAAERIVRQESVTQAEWDDLQSGEVARWKKAKKRLEQSVFSPF